MTSDAIPGAAAAVFGDGLGRARRYADLLAGPGIERGLIGPREAGRLWERHLLNCAVLAELVPESARLVDLGSGAGLPGIPLAIVRKDCRVDLVEPLLRRATFLSEMIAELGLTNCRVVRARAEDAARSGTGAVGVVGSGAAGAPVTGADVVTARAVAPLARLARWAAPLLRQDGMLLAVKGSTAGDEVARDGDAARDAGIEDLTVVLAGRGVLVEPTTVVRGRRTSRPAPSHGPRPRSPRGGTGRRH